MREEKSLSFERPGTVMFQEQLHAPGVRAAKPL
jgi:hypothetical protein